MNRVCIYLSNKSRSRDNFEIILMNYFIIEHYCFFINFFRTAILAAIRAYWAKTPLIVSRMTILILKMSWCGEIVPSGRTPLVSHPITFTLKKNLVSSLKFTEDAHLLSCPIPLALIWIMMKV